MNQNTLMNAAGAPGARQIVFDKPLREGSGWAVTIGKPYLLELVHAGNRLYTTFDDHGKRLNVTLFGRSLTNGGYWHLVEDEQKIEEQQ